MAIRVKRRPRPVSESSSSQPRNKSELSFSIEQSHARQIRDLPKERLDSVIDAITEGIKPNAIAAFFGDQGWLDVAEKSFVQYINAFKRVYPDLLAGGSMKNLNGLVDPRKPRLDPETILEQAIRVQSRRLRIGVDFEERTTLTNQHLHKDVKVMADLAEKLDMIRNGTRGAGRPSTSEVTNANSSEVSEAMRMVDGDETKQDKIATLMGSLAHLMQRKKKSEALPIQTAN